MPGLFGNENPKIQEIVLERLKFAVHEAIGPQVMESVRIEQFAGMVANDMLLTLTAELLAEKIESQEIVRTETVRHDFMVVDGPFQRWKDRHKDSWWLRWFVRWRPVVFVTQTKSSRVQLRVNAEDYAAFPKIALAPPPPEWGPVVFKRIVRSDTYQEED